MEATKTDGLHGFSYSSSTPVQAAITRGTDCFSSVLGVRVRGRDLLHTNVEHPARFLGAGVQVAVPYYPTYSKIARNHVYNRIIQ